VREAVPAQPADDALDHRERLPAVDRVLHLRIEVLHADRGAVDAGGGQCGDVLLGGVAGIELDRDLGAGGEVEAPAQQPGQRQPVLRRQHRRAAAADVQVGTAKRCGRASATSSVSRCKAAR
jgi:hypothetical protein